MDLSYKITCIFFLFFFSSQAQQSRIEILAPDYIGDKIYVWEEVNAISASKELIIEDQIKDSVFYFEVESSEIRRYLIGIDFQVAKLYIQPGKNYKAFFPKHQGEELRTLSWNAKASLVLIDADSTDINMKIENFENELSNYFSDLTQSGDSGEYVPFSAREVLEEFQAYSAKWKKDSLDYFNDYTYYISALTEFQLGEKRSDIFEKYLNRDEYLPLNVAYADFFNAYYRNYFDFYQLFPMKERFDSAYYSADPYAGLYKLLSEDKLLPGQAIREAVLVKGIYDLYSKGIKKDSTSLRILEKVKLESELEANAILAGQYLASLKRGSGNFPDFLCYTLSDTLSLSEYYQEGLNYIIVYGSWSSSAKAEMELMQVLKKEYRDQVSMIYISIDESFDDYASFVKENRNMAYANVWVGMHPEVLENLAVYDVPRFYIVDANGQIKQWNALSPSKGIEEVFYVMKKEEEKRRKDSFLNDQPNKSNKDK